MVTYATAAEQFPVQPQSALNTNRLIIGPSTIMLLLISLPFAWLPDDPRRSTKPSRNRGLKDMITTPPSTKLSSPPTNDELPRKLENVSKLLTAQGANRFRAEAYHRAATLTN